MVREKKAIATTSEKPVKKTKSTGGRAKGKLTPYNKFMKDELARLREKEPECKHPERFKIAAQNWQTAKENPKNAK